MGMLPNLRRQWQEKHNEFLAMQAKANDRSADFISATRFLRLTMQSAILGVGALLVLDNQLSPGGMIGASILLGRALSPMDMVIASWRGVVSAREADVRLNHLLADHPPHEKHIPLPRPEGYVKVEALFLAAPGSHSHILKNISFTALPGTLIAVVGPSASGKSSLARALVGVWEPLSGTVRLDNAEVAKWDKDELGPWIGYLPQDVELIQGSIADNIARFGELDGEKIVASARKAGVHEIILGMPNGYETKIGEEGLILSGGLRQRVGLARALYDDPSLIVLDEPNANLDEAGDQALIEALRENKKEKRTTFVMTHRLNLLREADSIMLLANGEIHTYAPREEVIKAMLTRFRPTRSNLGQKLA
jgi:PrtD family type I secretion system ABC transporter